MKIPSAKYYLGKVLRNATLLAILLFAPLFLTPLFLTSFASADPGAAEQMLFSWLQLEPGLEFGEHQFFGRTRSSTPDVLLLRIDPKAFEFRMVSAGDLGKQQTDVKTLTEFVNGIVGINANFFDPQGAALGLIINEGAIKHQMHRGGNLLTGIFFVTKGRPGIVHRDSFNPKNIDLATQAGPRLVANGKILESSSPYVTSRRSGVALTRNGKVILYATVTRFPGASFSEVQRMLLAPELEITDALNLDGGSSSQLFIAKHPTLGKETSVSGGAEIPVALVVKRKQ